MTGGVQPIEKPAEGMCAICGESTLAEFDERVCSDCRMHQRNLLGDDLRLIGRAKAYFIACRDKTGRRAIAGEAWCADPKNIKGWEAGYGRFLCLLKLYENLARVFPEEACTPTSLAGSPDTTRARI